MQGAVVLALAGILSSVCATDRVDVVAKLIDSPLDDIQWVTSKVVYLLSETGILYRSSDGGRTWSNEMNKLPMGATATEVISIDISPVDSNNIFFRGGGIGNWYTLDRGASYKFSELDLHDVRLHPTQPLWLLGSTMSPACEDEEELRSFGTSGSTTSSSGGSLGGSNSLTRVGSSSKASVTPPVPSGTKYCFKSLVYSKDFGKTWTHSLDYVVQFDWSPPIASGPHDADDLVYVTAHEHKLGNQRFGFWDKNVHFYSSRDYFKTSQKLVPHGNRFLFGDLSFLFVAAVNPFEETEVSLEISRDNETHMVFHSAVLPVDLSEHSYTVLDNSEGSVFIHVNHRPFSEGAENGHVYVSDWSGLKYTLSLPYNHRSAEGKCDFERAEGVEGVYLANFVDVDDFDRSAADEEEDMERPRSKGKKTVKKAPPKIKTVISFDKGAEWSYLAPPSRDSLDKPLVCPSGKVAGGRRSECHLHLHGVTDPYGPFYSTPAAPGLIIATGTVGRYLREGDRLDINTYFSRDAGLTWREVAKGSHIYEIGDHGSLIVMAYDEEPTNIVKYTWNEGLTWNELKITSEKFQIENIIIEPSSTSEEFIVYGWRASETGGEDEGVVVYLDFGQLHPRICQGHGAPDTADSDYEKWSPSDGRPGGNCLMGHTLTYVRRKQDHQCFNPELFERPVFQANCACTRADFECDYGYTTHDIEGGPCVEMKTPPKHADPTKDLSRPGHCDKTYRITKGYRRVPGDTCVGGEQWDAVEMACPSAWVAAKHAGKAVFVVLTLIVLSLAVVTFASRAKCACCKLGERFNFFRYRLIKQDEHFLNEEEFNQSAQLMHADEEDALEMGGDDGAPATTATGKKGTEKNNTENLKKAASRGGPTFSALPQPTRGPQTVPVLHPPSNDL